MLNDSLQNTLNLMNFSMLLPLMDREKLNRKPTIRLFMIKGRDVGRWLITGRSLQPSFCFLRRVSAARFYSRVIT